MRKPNHNLWCVEVVDNKNDRTIESLLVCATSSEVAARKADRWSKRHGYTRTHVGDIKHEGTIDVF